MGGVELFHRGGGDEFVGISEALDERLEFADDGGDLLVEFEFLLDLDYSENSARVWNSIPLDIRDISSTESFSEKLKLHCWSDKTLSKRLSLRPSQLSSLFFVLFPSK